MGFLPIYWILTASVVGVFLMGFDKRQAKKGGRRVPERRLFLVALLGGTPGMILGMYAFHHKTRHWYFKWGLPLILVLQLGVLWFHWEYGVTLL
ncbi:MAG: DUF1294 domain-containing protein [Oscillospiraceae bacterium]|nr:DUF1294 domain-containing protein [Oscillospiraceae bacterium]